MNYSRKRLALKRASSSVGGASLAACLALTGCGDGKPSASDIQNDIQQKLGSCSSVLNIQNVVKDDGQDVDSTHYQAEVEYDAALNAPVSFTADPNQPFAGTWNGLPSGCDATQFVNWLGVPFDEGNMNMGSTFTFPTQPNHIKLTMTFVKGDNGWEMQ